MPDTQSKDRRKLLWVDEAADELPVVEWIARKAGFHVSVAYTLVEAVDWVEKRGIPDCLILDAIVPLGQPRQTIEWLHGEPDEASEGRYRGLMLLERFPELTKATILLSIARQDQLLKQVARAVQDPPVSVPKLGLASQLNDLRSLLEGFAKSPGISETHDE